MKEITAYQSADGMLHTSESDCRARDDDLLGEELDGLLKMFQLDVDRVQEHRALLGVMKKRDELLKVTKEIVRFLEHSLHNED